MCVWKILYIFKYGHFLVWRQICEPSEAAQGAKGHDGFNKCKLANEKVIWKHVEYDTDTSGSCCLCIPFLPFLIKWKLWLVIVTLCKRRVVWKYLGLWLCQKSWLPVKCKATLKKKIDRCNLWDPMWYNHTCWGRWHHKAILSYLLKVMASGRGSWGLEESNDHCHLQEG